MNLQFLISSHFCTNPDIWDFKSSTTSPYIIFSYYNTVNLKIELFFAKYLDFTENIMYNKLCNTAQVVCGVALKL